MSSGHSENSILPHYVNDLSGLIQSPPMYFEYIKINLSMREYERKLMIIPIVLQIIIRNSVSQFVRMLEHIHCYSMSHSQLIVVFCK